MSILLDSDLGVLTLRLGRLLIEYRRYVRLHQARWRWRWL